MKFKLLSYVEFSISHEWDWMIHAIYWNCKFNNSMNYSATIASIFISRVCFTIYWYFSKKKCDNNCYQSTTAPWSYKFTINPFYSQVCWATSLKSKEFEIAFKLSNSSFHFVESWVSSFFLTNLYFNKGFFSAKRPNYFSNCWSTILDWLFTMMVFMKRNFFFVLLIQSIKDKFIPWLMSWKKHLYE